METGATTSEQRLRIDKLSDGDVTCLRLAGTIDEQFEGKRLAATLKAQTLVLDLGEVRKISSFGCREWVDFVGDAGARVGELILVECAPKVVDQLNMVLNFAGKGRVYSFYAPYRCDYCDVERRVLMQVDKDMEAIRALKAPEQPCPTCGNASYFDENAASYFSYVGQQTPFELDARVAAFLSSKLSYEVESGGRRFRAEKQIEGRATILRLAGDLDAEFPADKVAEGLEGTLLVDLSAIGKVDPPGAAAWRSFVGQISSTCDAVWLSSCPPVFLDRLARAEDLGRAVVLSLVMPYTCQSCAATASHVLDVGEHFDVLKFATPPEVMCPDCGGKTVCAASETLLAHLGALPRPNVPAEVRKLLSVAGTTRDRRAVTADEAGRRRAAVGPTVLLASVAAAVVALAVVLGWTWLRGPRARVASQAGSVGPVIERSAEERPAWAPARPGAAGCEATTCVGASMVAADLAGARAEAVDSAIEAHADQVATSLSPEQRDLVAPLYGPVRQKALAEAGTAARDGRRAVADAVRRAATAPLEPDADYWERHEEGTVAYVRFDAGKLPPGGQAPATSVLGAQTVAVPAALSWRYPTVRGGALLLSVGNGPLRDAGLARGDIVLEVEGVPVTSAAGLAARLGEAHERVARDGGAIRLLVKSGDGDPRAFNVAVAKAMMAPPRGSGQPGTRPPGETRPAGSQPGTGVNVWERTGGGSPRDNPDE